MLTRGAYVGDVTALCALAPPPPPSGGADAGAVNDASLPPQHDTLLAGVGASLQWYDPFDGGGGEAPLLTATVFGAARVHGIAPAPELDAIRASEELGGGGGGGGGGAAGARAVLVWGERRIVLVALHAGADVTAADRRLYVVVTLPPLGHWVHDARPLAPDTHPDGHGYPTIAVGLADNAVEQWTVGPGGGSGGGDRGPRCLRRVECAARCMLYSLALRGSSMAGLEVASGTIFNEVQLWAPGGAQHRVPPAAAAGAVGGSGGGEGDDNVDRDGNGIDRPEPWAVLRGHEGSIMRVNWSADGKQVYSTSDDRTARIWPIPPRHNGDDNGGGGGIGGGGDGDVSCATTYVSGAAVTMFGHTGRVWDCQLAMAGRRTLFATAGEDCTVRLWAAPPEVPEEVGGAVVLETPVAVLRGHRGRGVWRAVVLRAPGRGLHSFTIQLNLSSSVHRIIRLISRTCSGVA